MNTTTRCKLICRDNQAGFCDCFKAKHAWAEMFDGQGVTNPKDRVVTGNCEWREE